MTKILISIHKAEDRCNAAAQRFFSHHPVLGYLTAFIGIPVFILVAVFVFTTILALPFALIFGWFSS